MISALQQKLFLANSLSQYVIAVLGLAVALLLWNTTNSLTGWSIGRFGLLWLRQQLPRHPALNLLGLVLGILGWAERIYYYFIIAENIIINYKLYIIRIL
jgi:hypothetical protein